MCYFFLCLKMVGKYGPWNLEQTKLNLVGAFDIGLHLTHADFYLESDLEKFVGPQSQEPRSRDSGWEQPGLLCCVLHVCLCVCMCMGVWVCVCARAYKENQSHAKQPHR